MPASTENINGHQTALGFVFGADSSWTLMCGSDPGDLGGLPGTRVNFAGKSNGGRGRAEAPQLFKNHRGPGSADGDGLAAGGSRAGRRELAGGGITEFETVQACAPDAFS